MIRSVAEPHSEDAQREWFQDGRGPGRHMETAWHPREGVVVLSLWQGGICRATFQLPIGDAPRLINELAGALGDAASATPPSRQPSLTERLRTNLQSEEGQVIPFAQPDQR